MVTVNDLGYSNAWFQNDMHVNVPGKMEDFPVASLHAGVTPGPIRASDMLIF